MKKLLVTILSIVVLTIGYQVEAQSFNTYLSGNKTIHENGTVTVTVGVNNASNLWGFKAPISYDSNKLTLTNYVGQNGFGIAVGTNLVVDSSNGKNGNVKVATLTFKATSNFKIGEKTTISLGAAEGSDGNTIMNGTGSSISISVVAPKSSNNNLKSLSIENETLDFKKDNLNYSLTVDYAVSNIVINATVEDSKATVSGSGSHNLNIYNNSFPIVVKAEDGSEKTYTIQVIRKDEKGNTRELSTDNSLKSLEITGYDLVFDANVLEYTVLLKNNNTLDIKTVSNDENATVSINNPSNYIKGNNVIEISVISESGVEKKYKINAIQLEKVEDKAADSNNIQKIIFMVLSIVEFIVIVVGVVLVVVKKKKKSNNVETI